MKARSSIPPWKRPGWVLWFVLAAVCSCWFILHMPVDSRRMRDAPTTATVSYTHLTLPTILLV